MAQEDQFVEYCEVHNNFYGTAKHQIAEIQNKKLVPLLDIDVQGAIKFEQTFPQSNFVAVCPLNFADLEERLRQRGTETEQQLQTRFRNA
jgi:guanylate kinase